MRGRRMCVAHVTGWTAVLLFCSAGFCSRPAAGDGMPMPHVDAIDYEVTATAQRAVLWLRDGVWEIHIQPHFERAQGRAAWVVPFPALPEISESDAALFRDLELMTAPVFITYCQEDYGDDQGSGCNSGDAAGASNQNGSGQKSDVGSTVKVWDSGQVGQLDYVVLSARDGDDLTQYLQDEGYVLPDGAASLIGDFETEGQFFFVAKLAADADPQKPISPVRFKMPAMETPLYPLRLTGLAVSGTEELELTLWVVFPEVYNEENLRTYGYIPEARPFQQLDGNPMDGESYDAAMRDFFQTHIPDTLLMLYGQRTDDSVAATGQRCDMDEFYYYQPICADAEELDLDAHAWSSEVQEMIAADAWLFRYAASLDDVAMETDLVLTEVEWTRNRKDDISADNVFTENVGICQEETEDEEEYVSCSVSGGFRFPGWFALAVMAFALLLVTRRLRGR